MKRHFLPAVLILIPAATGIAAEQGQLDASPSIFSVLAAINAAGYDAGLNSAANHPLRAEIRRELAAKNVPCLPEIKQFVEEHRQKDGGAELSQYISYALVVNGPPAFEYKLRPNELPPDVVPLEGFSKLMARFYREGDLDALWRKAQPAFDGVIARYHEPVTRAVTEVNAYLGAASGGYLGRRFQIYVDLLGQPNQIQSRSYADDYFIVLTPSPEPQVDDVRHAYLHYLLDPLATKFSEELMKKKALADYAQGAPFLEEYYKSDFLLLATECMIKAIEARLLHGPAAGKQEMVKQALGEGFVLTPAFFELLSIYESQDRAMRLHFPDLVSAIDLKKEERRLNAVEFSQERRLRKAKAVREEPKVELTGAQKTLAEAEDAYAGRDLARARQGYLRVLQETDQSPLHAKAYYGMARIAALEKDPELSERLFRRTLESSPDPQVRAWALVYLGRLSDAAGERAQAGEHYRAALAVEGASPAARKAAEQGLQQSFQKEK